MNRLAKCDQKFGKLNLIEIRVSQSVHGSAVSLCVADCIVLVNGDNDIVQSSLLFFRMTVLILHVWYIIYGQTLANTLAFCTNLTANLSFLISF